MTHNQTRSFLLCALILASTIGLSSCLSQKGNKGESLVNAKPNIILIMADDLDFDEIAAYNQHADESLHNLPSFTAAADAGFAHKIREGHTLSYNYIDNFITPNLDKMANDGAVFKRFYVTSPVCNPSRYSLMTGKYATRSENLRRVTALNPELKGNHIVRFNADLENERTIAHVLNELGYKTGFVGKWHNFTPPNPAVPGLDPQADPRDPDIKAQLEAAYQKGVAHLKEVSGFQSVGALYGENIRGLQIPQSLWKTDKVMHGHNLEWMSEAAQEFITASDSDPFFLYVSLPLPHGWMGPIGDTEDAKLTPRGILDELPKSNMPSRESVETRFGSQSNAHMALWMDDFIGSLLQKLEADNLDENTLIIFTSDHGNRGKDMTYEGARVPTLAFWPGTIPAGTVVEDMAANIDIAPTLFRLAGGETEDLNQFDGEVLLNSLMEEVTDLSDRHIILEIGASRAVVTQDWKYIANRVPPTIAERFKQESDLPNLERKTGWSGDWIHRVNGQFYPTVRINYDNNLWFPHYFDTDQLYNLKTDPFEQINLFSDKKYQSFITGFQSDLNAHMQATDQVFGEFGDVLEEKTTY